MSSARGVALARLAHVGLFAGVAAVAAAAARADELARVESVPLVAMPLVVEGSGFYKPQATWFHLPNDLVGVVGDINRSVSEARDALPPDLAKSLPDDVTLPNDVGLFSQTLRAHTVLRLGDDLELDAAYQLALVLGTDPRFAASSASSSFFGGGSSPSSSASGAGGDGGDAGGGASREAGAAKRRLVDFDPILAGGGSGVVLTHNLDQLALAYHSRAFNLVVGRQVVSWGTGHLWNPTDLFSPFAPTDVDREVRRGADAVRVSVPLGETTELDAIWLPQLSLEENGGVLRGRTNVDGFDISASVAKYAGDIVLGADTATDIDRFGVYAEGALTLPLPGVGDNPSDDDDAGDVYGGNDPFVRVVVGATARPTESWFVTLEYYFNSYGTDEPGRYLAVLTSPREVRGEVFGAGRHYVGAVSAFTINDDTTFATTALVNVLDPSVLFVPSLEISLEQSVLLRLFATLPLGAGPQRFADLTGDDLLLGSDAFKRATETLGLRSEYGTSPASVAAQLGVYF